MIHFLTTFQFSARFVDNKQHITMKLHLLHCPESSLNTIQNGQQDNKARKVSIFHLKSSMWFVFVFPVLFLFLQFCITDVDTRFHSLVNCFPRFVFSFVHLFINAIPQNVCSVCHATLVDVWSISFSKCVKAMGNKHHRSRYSSKFTSCRCHLIEHNPSQVRIQCTMKHKSRFSVVFLLIFLPFKCLCCCISWF
jgi:hypothetical protein